MADKTKIQWSDATWSPLRVRVRADAAEIATAKGYMSLIQIAEKMAGHVGQHCEHVSPGCVNCYSGTHQRRCLSSGGTGLPFDRRSRDLVEPFVDEKTLAQPLRWKRPRKIFVANQTDLFGEWYTDEMIDRVFAVMAMTPRHTYQVLTKRPERMRAYFAKHAGCSRMVEAIDIGTGNVRSGSWIDPLENVWLGASCENQETADERIPLLLQTPAAVRFVSYEPALGPVSLGMYLSRRGLFGKDPLPGLTWVIVGGESGPGARPFHLQWARYVIEQCAAAGVACFVKQAGAHPIVASTRKVPGESAKEWNDREHSNFLEWPQGTSFGNRTGQQEFNGYEAILRDRKGGDPSEWTEWMRVRQFPEVR